MAAIGAAVDTSARGREADAARERPNRHGAEEVQALKARNNFANWKHLARIYLVIAAAVTGAVWAIESARAGELSRWWTVPVTLVAITVIGASQHQFGGAIHEGTHYMLFANRKLNELASDWLAAFEYADVADAAGIAREVEASLRRG